MDRFIVNADDLESDRRIGYGGIEAQQPERRFLVIAENSTRLQAMFVLVSQSGTFELVK